MKKIKLFFGILVGLMIFSSCGNDDDTDPDFDEDLIVGVWKPIKHIDVCSSGNESVEVASVCEQLSRITFTSDGVIKAVTFYNDDSGDCVEFDSSEGGWTLSGNNLTIALDGEVSNLTVLELTSSAFLIGEYVSDGEPCDGDHTVTQYNTQLSRVEE